ncbi:hypothetical protein F1C16_14730 [Hymenobacter sp. NBH84]|uniref:hypothetical protein n=1 Tax=Hymenobacter sp. NBH84 TaxID=2596915 RepID=UPI0016284917|nr:hypothetical protein [Hymenobacter sp. NBH84]QNE40731.1 hypothetical protein F1C16_14730 [Hymenobacter sp. NBH84]
MFNFPQLLTALPADVALEKLRNGESLQYYHIIGKLDLLQLSTDNTYCFHSIIILHCEVDDLSGVVLSYERPMILSYCHFHRADFIFAYFVGGLLIEECVFYSYLNFSSGGHNKPGFPVRLLRNLFKGFVNFFDCWYEGEVHVEYNIIKQGTNLLGAPHNIPVTFDIQPIIQKNVGNLYCADEGSSFSDR